MTGICGKADFWVKIGYSTMFMIQIVIIIFYIAEPDLTPCFEQTVLVWGPCGFMWIFAVPHFYKLGLVGTRDRKPFSVLNVLKIIALAVLIGNQITSFSLDLYTNKMTYTDFSDEFMNAIGVCNSFIKICTFVLTFALTIMNHIKEIQTSSTQAVFWFIFSASQLIILRTKYLTHDLEVLSLIFEATTVALALSQFLLNCVTLAITNKSMEMQCTESNCCPDISANFLSRLTLSWVGNLVRKGYTNCLEIKDLWDLRPQDRSEILISRFIKCSHKDNYSSTTSKVKINGIFGNIILPLVKTFGVQFLFCSSLKQLADILAFVSPQIMSLLITFVEKEDSYAWKGYLYAIILFLTASSQSLSMGQYMYQIWALASQIRSTMSCVVYRKALVLSAAARKKKSTGEIVNLMSVDVDKLTSLLPWLDKLWGAPIQICLALYFLYAELGPAIFAGLGVLILFIPLNIIVSSKLKQYQSSFMERKDERIKVLNEVLSGVKIVKLYAWEPSFEAEIKRIRKEELKFLRKKSYMISLVELMWANSNIVVALVSFSTYILIDDSNVLDAHKAFVSLSLFNLLNSPIILLPMMISQATEAFVSMKRLNDFMNAEEYDKKAVERNSTEKESLLIENADFQWSPESPTLKNINLKINEGSIVAIVGTVGCGKSSILSAFLGEMKKLNGRVNVKGSTAFVSQQAWIQNATLRDNVLFGLPFQSQKYEHILDCCALRPDISILPGGDNTEIGEKGINLSGGQKQRVSLARSIYNDADIYFLDDPLSAVDTHVGKHIFENVLSSNNGLLKNKTRVLVTHGTEFLSQMDCIYVMKDGEITEQGTYNELINQNGEFAEFLFVHGTEGIGDGKNDAFNCNETRKDEAAERSVPNMNVKNTNSEDIIDRPNNVDNVANETLIEAEEIHQGKIGWSIYGIYFKAVGWISTITIVMFFFISSGCAIGSNIWLSVWSTDQTFNNGTSVDIAKRNVYLSVYGILGVLQCTSMYVGAILLSLGGVKASTKLHANMLHRILKAPMEFFEKTPLGRIINRFSGDMQIIDQELGWLFLEAFSCFFQVTSTLVVVIYSTPIFLTVAFPLGLVYFFLQKYYIITATQVFKLEAIARSPIYSHFTETLNGISTIRAFRVQDKFIEQSEMKINEFQKTKFPCIAVERWLGVRLEAAANGVILFAAIFAVFGRKTLSPSIVGLSLSYALQITQNMSWFTILTSYLENEIVSVDRVNEYIKAPQEANWTVEKEDTVSDNNTHYPWPNEGRIIFDNYHTCYRSGLSDVLKGINCSIEPAEKIGIVGRTGAGKSTLALGLFRIIEKSGGKIVIDGKDIAELGLHDIRQKLTIIPQDCVLFSGTLRFNLDPFGYYSDATLWSALESSHLKPFVEEKGCGLEYEITEGGENLSSGQRQLVCLARCLLRRTKILILDEATAAIDLETDSLIQETIKREFADCTVLTVAHRLHTIMDSTRIIVLEDGKILEFDTPMNLLKDSTSSFYAMAKDAGLVK